MANRETKIIIAGAGMGGLTAAAGLSSAGFDVTVYEQSSKLGWVGSGLSLMTNALTALASVGIRPRFEGRAEEFESLYFLTKKGRPIRTINFGEITRQIGHPNLAIHRGSLHEALLEQASGCKIELGAAATGFSVDGDKVTLKLADGRTATGDVLIGADGFNSVIRREIAGPENPTDWNYMVWRATPPFRHPKVTKGYVAHYWGRGQRFGLADIGNGNVYWWGTKNMSAEKMRSAPGGKKAIQRYYRGWADEIQAVIAATPEDSISSLPAQDRPFLERWGKGPITLVGDAAHPMLTSLGQGACIAIEDGAVLTHCLSTIDDPQDALRAYEDRRRERARAIVETSRALSRIEQYESPIRSVMRDLYFRFVSERTLTQQNRLVLTFPGVE